MIASIGRNAVTVTPSDTLYIRDSLISWQRETPAQVTSVVLATGVFTQNTHGYNNGDAINVQSLGTTTGLVYNTQYFVTNVTANTFTVSASFGGATVTLGGANTTPPTFVIIGRRVTATRPASLYVGVSGDINVLMVDHPDTDIPTASSRGAVLFKNVPVGPFPYAVKKVFNTNTTATQIIAIY